MLAAIGARAQTALHFDVASVKVSANQDILESRPRRSPGRFRWTTQLWLVLEYAYNVSNWRIIGNSTRLGDIYEIDATHDAKATEDQVRTMLQSLLADRFKLRFHRVSKDAEGYALTVAKGGPKMQDAREGEIPALPEWVVPSTDPAVMEELVTATVPTQRVGAITGRRATMLQFTSRLQRLLNTNVLDQTGLTGRYYFGFQYALGDDANIPFPDLFSAIKELGLRLEKHKGPVEMLVIDSFDRVPTEN
jgi:uncharacterized protein (TIGR03435 family)